MKRFLLIITFFGIISCHQNTENKHPCIYLLSDLYRNYDSVKFRVSKSRTKDWVDLEEYSGSNPKQLYQFDKNNRLRFYAFLFNDSDYNFSEKYDSLGNTIGKTGSEIVKWFIEKHGSDSLDITFLLYTIHRSYGNINLIFGKQTFQNIKLFKSSEFSNLIGGTKRVSLTGEKVDRSIYLSGRKFNVCSNDTVTFFRDSAILVH
jgi:hypothetical protein